MFAILLSGLWTAVAWLLRTVIIKFVVFTILLVIVEVLVGSMTSLLPDGRDLQGAFAGIVPGVWYFADLFAFTTGVPIVIAAFATRFIIRRIPVIG